MGWVGWVWGFDVPRTGGRFKHHEQLDSQKHGSHTLGGLRTQTKRGPAAIVNEVGGFPICVGHLLEGSLFLQG